MEEEIERIMPYLNSPILNEGVNDLKHFALQQGQISIIDYMKPIQIAYNRSIVEIEQMMLRQLATNQERMRNIQTYTYPYDSAWDWNTGSLRYPHIVESSQDFEDDDIYIK